MPSLSIELSDDLHARLVNRAAQRGFASIEQYVYNLLTADADIPATDTDLDSLLHMTRKGPHRTNGHASSHVHPMFIEGLERA